MSGSSPEPEFAGARGGASAPRRVLQRAAARPWVVILAGVAVAAALVQVTVTGPRVTVRWTEGVDAATRERLERAYELRQGRQDPGPEWRYELGDWSRDNLEALVGDPAVADTGYIDRAALTAERPQVRIGLRRLPFPFGADTGFAGPTEFLQWQSLCLLVAGGALLWAARLEEPRRRRRAAWATLAVVACAAFMFPLRPSLVTMGDAGTYTASRESFEGFAGVREIRYEAHLSHAILGRVYELLGRTEEAPTRALALLVRAATVWFVVSALVVGVAERWSDRVVRYLGLALLAPSALLYFGYRELGYLSLNMAVFPLIARGLHDGGLRVEIGSALAGLGAALHGFGLLSLAGIGLASFAAPASLRDRVRLALRGAAWGMAAYLGWMAVYVVLLELPVMPGHAEAIPWRPLLIDRVLVDQDRVNVALLSAAGGRDLFFTAWVVGAPLLVVAASLWRRCREEVRLALAYSLPSALFVPAFWPIQGLGLEMDLLVAAFPALYALTWICAIDARRTRIAAWLLASAHIAFWRIILDPRFVT